MTVLLHEGGLRLTGADLAGDWSSFFKERAKDTIRNFKFQLLALLLVNDPSRWKAIRTSTQSQSASCRPKRHPPNTPDQSNRLPMMRMSSALQCLHLLNI
jgi:hypothetical protein